MIASEEYECFRKKFKLDSLVLARYGNWVISLRPVQVTLGALVISLDRPCLCFSELEPAEARDLSGVYGSVEDALREFVGFQKINYLALMMVDSHLHFHAIPRYEGNRAFGGIEYPDYGWPALPDLGKGVSDAAAVPVVAEALRKIFISRGARK